MTNKRRKEITEWLNENDFALDIKPAQFDLFLDVLDAFEHRNKPCGVVHKVSISERKRRFADNVKRYIGKETSNGIFDRAVAVAFYDYWTEHSEKQTKMRFEKQVAFSFPRRIGTWMRNHKQFTQLSPDTRVSVDSAYDNILSGGSQQNKIH